MKVIIDADSIVYKSSGAAQSRNHETGIMEYSPVTHSYQNAKTLINKILDKCGSRDYVTYLTESHDETSFRKILFPDYKANRKPGQRPKYYHEVRDYMIANWKATIVAGIEADDAVCMAQYEAYEAGEVEELIQQKYIFEFFTHRYNLKGWDQFFPSVLVGIDKDLDQIPGLHFNYDKDLFYYITPLQGRRNFFKQLLEGDKSDNIPRIKYRWEKKDTFKKIDDAETEAEIIEIVCKEIEKCGKIAKEELQWRGELLHLRRFEEDRWKHD